MIECLNGHPLFIAKTVNESHVYEQNERGEWCESIFDSCTEENLIVFCEAGCPVPMIQEAEARNAFHHSRVSRENNLCAMPVG